MFIALAPQISVEVSVCDYLAWGGPRLDIAGFFSTCS